MDVGMFTMSKMVRRISVYHMTAHTDTSPNLSATHGHTQTQMSTVRAQRTKY